MKATLLKIKNVLGIEEAELQLNPSGVTCITGGNGTGKTSHIEAIKSLIDGGQDATLIRNGEDTAEIVLVLDDNTRIQKKLKRDGKGDLKVSGPDGLKSKLPPKTFIEMLVDGVSADPVRFILAKPKERVSILLEAAPLRVTPQQLEEITGIKFSDEDCEGHAMEVLNRVRSQIFNDRTGINRSADDKQKSSDGILKDLLPADMASEIEALPGAYEREEEIQKEISSLKEKIGKDLEEQKAELARSVDESIATIDQQIAEFQNKIAALNQERNSRKSNLATDIEKARNQANENFAIAIQPLDEERTSLKQSIAKLEQLSSELERSATLREMANKHAEEALLLKEQSSNLTKALQEIDNLKARLAEEIPIPELTIDNEGKNPDLLIGGIPFDRLNRASQVQIALKVALLRAGELPLVLMDNAECLDAETFKAFEDAAKNTNLQFLVTRVSEGPLTVS